MARDSVPHGALEIFIPLRESSGVLLRLICGSKPRREVDDILQCIGGVTPKFCLHRARMAAWTERDY